MVKSISVTVACISKLVLQCIYFVGIVWKQKDPHVFYSSSKDCTLYQHMFRDAARPGDNANPVGVDINIRGDVASACSDKLAKPQGTGFLVCRVTTITNNLLFIANNI